MDVSAPDVLIGIMLVGLATCAAYAVRSYRRRSAVTTEVNRAIRNLPRRAPVPKQALSTDDVPTDDALPDEESDVAAGVGVPEQGRHREIEELMRASTYRLSPDRLARAKVPGQENPTVEAT